MYTRLVGDIHGMLNDYRFYSLGIGRQLKKDEHYHNSIQVGDFGFGFRESWDANAKQWLAENSTHSFIRGNHDNPAICKTASGYIPDGRVEGHTMFIGGAWSIDNPNAPPGWYKRVEGVDWWADEQCSEKQFQHFLDVYATVKPRVMITHDCPVIASRELFFKTQLVKGEEYPNRTSSYLQAMYDIHQPEFWFFGHWHHTTHVKLGNTHFQCIGELDYIDFDLDSLEFAV